MRGQASTRGFPNCAMSLSVIDRFASAINTGHQALATLYSSPSLSYSLPSTTHVHIPYNISLFIPLTTETILHRVYRSYPFPRARVYHSLSLSHSLFPPLLYLRALPPSLPSLDEGWKTLTFKRASEGEHGALSTLSQYSPFHLVPLAFPSSPLAAACKL